MERNQHFDDFINETYDSITIAGCTFDASDILAALDPIAYRVYATDYLDDTGAEDER